MSHPSLAARAAPFVAVVLVTLGTAPPAPGALSGPAPAAENEKIRGLVLDGRFAEADTLAAALLDRMELGHGRRSVAAAEAMRALVETRVAAGRAREPATADLAREAVEILEDRVGPGDSRYASALVTFGYALWNRGESEAAVAPLERALAIHEATLAAEDLELARTLSNVAAVAGIRGDGRRAEALSRRVLAIREARLGPEDPRVLQALNNVSWALDLQGKHVEAVAVDRALLVLRERVLGRDHVDVAKTLNDLGLGLWRLGELAEARECHQRSLAIREIRLPPDHPDVAQSLNNLAIVMRATGNWREAASLYERALAIHERVNGANHPRVAIVLNNLGNLHTEAGRFEEAIAYQERGLGIRRDSLGPRHENVAWSLNGLADAELGSGRLPDALAHIELALEILEEALGPASYHLAYAELAHAQILDAMGLPERALAAARSAVSIRTEALGPEHWETAHAQVQLAALLFKQDEGREAFDLAVAAERTGRRYARLTTQTLSERHALNLADSRPTAVPLLLDHLAAGTATVSERTRAWDTVVRARGLVLEEMATRRRDAGERTSPGIASLVDSLATARSQLARATVVGPRDDDAPDAYRGRLEAATREKDRLEEALARASVIFRKASRLRTTGLDDVRAALPPHDALVAYVRWVGGGADTDSRYGAFVARGDGAPRFVGLGPAVALDALIAGWRREIRSGSSTLGWRRRLGRYREVGASVRESLWDPVAELVGDAARVWVVPAGEIHLVSLDALPSGEDSYLVESDVAFLTLTTERALTRPEDAAIDGERLLVIGGADFDHRPPDLARDGAFVSDLPDTAAASRFRGARSACGSFRELHFAPLPRSREEAETIAARWPAGVTRLVGSDASETALKRSAPGQNVLHVATHGFFITGECPASRDARGVDVTPAEGLAEVLHENPLLRSGLALAGANRRTEARGLEDDGVLTAEEVALLDLSSVRLAVLSACDTGSGEVRAGEGVFGLRRAFEIAGARTLVMSLWPVGDGLALAWMESFYERRAAGDGAAQAARTTSRTLLEASRSRGQGTHPAHWAAFTVSGQ